MIDQKDPNNQLPKELNSIFSELEINKHLRQAGIKKILWFQLFILIPVSLLLDFSE
jgi:hypothetical protein